MEREFYKSPEPSRLMLLFWKAAGGDEFILRRSTYSDQVKYMCLGGIIVATGLMAAIAGGYAFYTIFEPKGSALETGTDVTTAIQSVFFGIAWGLMIFNLDRFIVSSTGKGDGTEAITWEEFKGAIPRIVMGSIIALTISKPVEIRMFKSEIDVALSEAQMEQKQAFVDKINADFAERITIQMETIEGLKNEIKEKEDYLRERQDVFDEEMSGGAGPRGYGPEAKKKEAAKDQARRDFEDVKKANQPLIDEALLAVTALRQEKEEKISKSEIVSNSLDGLLERIKLAHEIAGFWISLFITLLFMAIELTPIFFKLMLIKSPYDFIKDNIEELMKAERGIHIQYNYHKDKTGQERDLITYLEKEELLLEKRELQNVQKELTEYALSKYKADMMAKIDANPEQFIQVSSPKTDEEEG